MLTDAQWSTLRDVVTLLVLGLTVWATIYGPVRAVVIQRDSEEERESKRRQYGILHSLMKTRAWALHQDHVMAINLIQLEFYQHDAIQVAFRAYREHLAMKTPPAIDVAGNVQFDEARKDRFYTLVKAIADVLGIHFDKADLQRLAYTPQGWHDDVSKQDYLRSLMIEVFEGRRPVPMSTFHISTVNRKFPDPPPKVEQPDNEK